MVSGKPLEPLDILAFVEQDGPAKIKLQWVDPTHLDVTYENAVLTFQVVKVQELTIGTRPSGRSS